jgi:hypothetical protein
MPDLRLAIVRQTPEIEPGIQLKSSADSAFTHQQNGVFMCHALDVPGILLAMDNGDCNAGSARGKATTGTAENGM